MSDTHTSSQDFTGESLDEASIRGKELARASRRNDVWRAEIQSRIESVALKELRRFLIKNEKAVEAFRNEIHNWSRVNHPNILPFLGVVRDTISNDPRYIISPWQSNGGLLKFVTRENPSTLVRLRLLVGASKGLTYLHEEGMAHGYLTTSHILVSDDLDALICDFGAIGADEEIFADKSSRWLAPEALKSDMSQVGCELADEQASDVYSFGMVMYACLSGRRPFSELRGKKITLWVLQGGKPLRDFKGWKENWCTDEMWELIVRCWSTNPKERPSMKEVHKELETIERREMTS
ncbi:hypothetical protein QCA50_007861 [Cerrena zonata]|uniref:Protein kinase domain-containing protein n=1 Tax=Cerrena zonata TaxID=2478898 RepID=A0AAW0GJG3_9APHY